MTEQSLKEYLKGKTQARVAADIGVTQGAVWSMLRSGRRIMVCTHGDGRVEAYEIKPVGRKTAA